MSMLKVVAVRDVKIGAFGRPFFVRHVNEAIRSFSDEVNRADSNNQLYLHPEDFQLYLLGDFGDSDGLLESKKPSPEFLIAGDSVRVTS